MLKLEGVSKIYRVGTFGGQELHAVSGVSFEIGEGEVVSVIGESGSGKSTLGRMILRLTPSVPDASTSEGQDVSRYPGRAPRNTTGGYRACSRTRSVRTTRSSRPTGSLQRSVKNSYPRMRPAVE